MISDLYYSGTITGETYLFCVENNINSEEDIIAFLTSGGEIPDDVRNNLLEIRPYVPIIENDLKDVKEEIHNTFLKEEKFIEVYESKIFSLDIRSRNAVIMFRNSCSDDEQFVKELINKSACTIISKYPYIGKTSIQRIQSFIDSIIEETGYSNNKNNSFVELCPDIDYRLPLYKELVSSLSVRSQHALATLLDKANGSLSGLYSIIKSSSFSIRQVRNVGRKSAEEINAILPQIISLCESSCDNDLLQKNKLKQEIVSTISPKISKVLATDVDKLSELKSNLGYFPLFASVQSFILSFPQNYQTIINNCICIYNNQTILSRIEVSRVIGLCPERIRQLGVKLIRKISSYLKSVAKYTEEAKYAQLSFADINSLEHTNYNQNFIFWCLSVTCPSLSIIGDSQKSFLRPYNRTENLYLVSSSLCKIFNFELFIRKVFDEIEKEHYEDFEIDLDELIYHCFNGRVYFEHFPEVKLICQKLVLEQTDCTLVDNLIHIPKNSRYNIPELIEIILREKGEPMTAREILDEVNRKGWSPKSLSSIKAGAVNNHSVVPVGRSSTYALKEWIHGDSRGGTIREFALEYLLSLPEPIALVSSIGNYVRQFRPQSRDNSIKYNLLLESSGRFVLYSKCGEKYIGLSSASFSNDYTLVDEEACSRRDFRVSCDLIEQFKGKTGRLPKHNNGNDEEMRLYRFIYVTRGKIGKGLLNEDELSIFKQAVDE